MENKYYYMQGEVEKGDIIVFRGCHYIVSDITYQLFYEDSGYDVEFSTPKGNTYHWKQYFDGGHIIKRELKDN